MSLLNPSLGHHRLFRRFIVPYAVLIVGTFTASGWFFYHTTQQALSRELTKRLLTVAQTVRSVMNPRYLSQMTAGSETTTIYTLLLSDLKRLQTASNASHIYIVDQDHRMLLDANEQTPIGREYFLIKLTLPELNEVWKGHPMTSRVYQGSDGRHYKSGYAPLQDRDGTIVALVGVEAEAEYVDAVTATGRHVLIILFISVLILLPLGLWLSQSIITPLTALVAAIGRVGRGDPTAKVPISREDEIGYLSRRFNEMVDALAEKDRLLTQLYQEERERADQNRGYSDFLLGSITTGVIGIDLEGRITTCNPAALEILELPDDAVSGEGPMEAEAILGSDHVILELLRKTLADNEPCDRQELCVATRAGRQTWVGVRTAPLFDHDNRLIGASALFSDLTSVRKLQDEIRRKDRLAAIGQLSAGIAHEIRNPLAAIEGFSELLARRIHDEATHRLLEEIVQEVRHLNHIVSDFLTFAREPQLSYEPTDIGQLIENTLRLLLSTHTQPITLTGQIPRDLPRIDLDPNEFRRALFNILINAIQAMPTGGTLRVDVNATDEWFTVTITDSGPGIPDAVKDRIFTPFFTTKDNGSGLGLAIAHKIVGGHQGVIEVESSPGLGTAFTIRLPLERTLHETYPHL